MEAAAPVDPNIAVDDTSVFVDPPSSVRLVTGEDFVIPPCAWGTEIKLVRLLSDVIAAAWKSNAFRGDNPDGQVELVQFLFTEAPEKLTLAAAAILQKKPEWIEASLDSEGVLSVVLPFLRSRLTKILGTVQKQLGNMQGVAGMVGNVLQ
jgi:hypothetical protein